MTWPLEADGVQDFARGLDEILVVEESARSRIPGQGRAVQPEDHERPRVVGKFDEPAMGPQPPHRSR